MGLRLVAGLPAAPQQSDFRRLEPVRAVHQPLLRPHGLDEPHGRGRAAGRGQRPADLLHSRPRPQRRRAGQTGPYRAAAGRSRVSGRRIPLRRPAGAQGHEPDRPARRNDRPGRSQRGGQDHHRQPRLPLLRRRRGGHPGRRRRYPFVSPGRVPPPHRHRAPGAVSCSTAPSPRTSPTAGRTPRGRRSSPPRGPPAPTSSSSACPTATIRWSASGGNSSPAASGSGSASPGRC